jgi:phosphoglucomutase/phosphomannomutase
MNHPHQEPLVLTSEVTTTLVTRIAESYGAAVMDSLLVGFKYIGAALYGLERKGRFGPFEGDIDRFAVGVEESHGLLVTPDIRDKDAAGGALVLTVLASTEAQHGRSLVDTLAQLMHKHGVFYNHLGCAIMEGAQGRAHINAIMAGFRSTPPTHIDGHKVVETLDLQDPEGPRGVAVSDTDHSSRNMLCFELEGGRRLILRPSGTEPKAKIYVQTSAQPPPLLEGVTAVQAQLKTDAKRLTAAFIDTMLARVDINLPSWAHAISDHVSIDTKLQWANTLVPQLLEHIENDGDNAKVWLKTKLDANGRAQLSAGIDALILSMGFAHPRLSACFEPEAPKTEAP